MIGIVLFLHSWVRWVVVGSAVAVALSSLRALRKDLPFGRNSFRLARLWVGAVDLQALLGMVLFCSDEGVARAARHDVAFAMHEPSLRFFGYVHPLAMALVFAFTHATWIAVRRVAEDRRRFRRLFGGSAVVLGAVVLAIPWVFLSYGRPLFRADEAAAPDARYAEAGR